MKKKYSDKDLIRKLWTRLIISGLSMICLVIGTKHFVLFFDWKGILVVFMGIALQYGLVTAYENLLEENKK
jgi:hypothetical protein